MPPVEIMVVAGEASGDQHAADLVRELKRLRPDLHFFGMGGAKLAAEHVDRIYDAGEVSVMGIVEVLPKLWRILRVLKGLERAAARRRPACAILVDIPDFNLRLARKLWRLGIPVVYYVSPMVWAWRSGRVRQIRAYVDRMLCILPFEEPFYRERGVAAQYVGSPVLEQIPAPAAVETFRVALGLDPRRPTLALLPGSRASEVQRMLPAMIGAAKALSAERRDLQVVVPVAPGIDRKGLQRRFEDAGLSPALVSGRAAEVVGASDVAVVTSGTATLEAALMQRPFVTVYKVAAISALVGHLFLRVAHVSLANLLLRKRVIPELLQGKMTPARIAAEVRRLWKRNPDSERIVAELSQLRPLLGAPGASARAAKAVLDLLGSRSP